nr:MAG TPA: protein of unknown function (DUF5320) [Caudoviricetes sp.]
MANSKDATQVAEKVEKEEKVVKTETKPDKKQEEIDFLRNQNNELQDAMKALMAQFAELKNNMVPSAPRQGYSRDDEVVIVHLFDNAPGITTHIDLSNYSIDMAAFGETRTLTVQQFEELVGKYRSWFDRGIIAVGAGSEYYAKRNNLKMASESLINSDFIRKLGTMPMSDIQDIYEKVCDGQKDFIVSYWKRKFIEKAPDFRDLRKLQILNGFTNNSFEYEILELTTKK